MIFEAIPNSQKQFIEGRFNAHHNIKNWKRLEGNLYKVFRDNPADELLIFMDHSYTVGEMNVDAILTEYPKTNIILATSYWSQYTGTAAEVAKEQGVWVYNIKEFMGAIGKNDFKNYPTSHTN